MRGKIQRYLINVGRWRIVTTFMGLLLVSCIYTACTRGGTIPCTMSATAICYAASFSSGTRVTVPARFRHVRLTSLPSKDGTKCAILNRHPHSLQRAYHPFTKSGVQ